MIETGRAQPVADFRPWRYRFYLTGAFVKAREHALIIAGVDDVGIGRIRSDVSGFTSTHGIPVGLVDSAGIASAGDCDGGVVLLRAVDIIRKAVIRDHVIELRGGLIVRLGPVFAAVQGDDGGSVVT